MTKCKIYVCPIFFKKLSKLQKAVKVVIKLFWGSPVANRCFPHIGPPFVFYVQGFLILIEMCHLQRPLKLSPVISLGYSHGKKEFSRWWHCSEMFHRLVGSTVRFTFFEKVHIFCVVQLQPESLIDINCSPLG